MNVRHYSRIPPVLASYPLLWLALFYCFVLRARLKLGYWPEPYHPDPKRLGFDLHQLVLFWGIMAIPVVAFMAFGSALIGSSENRRGRLLFTLALLVLVAGGWYLLVRLDPGRFFAWFLD